MSRTAGIDVGGTFTDVVAFDSEHSELRLAKVLSTDNQADGLLAGLRQLGSPSRSSASTDPSRRSASTLDLASLTAIVHGSTVATNAVVARHGAATALVTTRGFRDVLEVRRRDRPDTYGLTGGYRPLVPRSRSYEVDERIDSAGRIRQPLDLESAARVAEALREARVDSVAVCLLNSYANPEHERQLGAALAEALPGVEVSLSVDVAPQAGEFERASTVVINAYVRPAMRAYLDRVQELLTDAGFGSQVQVMQSNGGLATARRAGEYAVRTLLSGPAAGTTAAAEFGIAAGFPDVISCDMGGTSFDVALIPDGAAATTTETSVEYGVPIRLPMIDIRTIGAGGGSIAWIDRGGILQVGPHSAGSSPGPACYRRGGEQPTVTDANLLLGRIDPDQSLGTESGFTLDVDAARRAIDSHVGRPLGLDVEAAALAIIRVANERMAGAIRTVSVHKGHDPRRFALLGFGGAGPLHIVELARAVGARTVVVPPYPGALSAIGCLVADAKHDYVHAVNTPVAEVTHAQVQKVLADHQDTGVGLLRDDGFAPDAITVEHVAEMSHTKQLYTVDVPLGADPAGWDAERLTEVFAERYAATYGGVLRNSPVMLVNLRSMVAGRRQGIQTAVQGPGGQTAGQGGQTAGPHQGVRLADAAGDPIGAPSTRWVGFDSGAVDTRILPRHTLAAGDVIAGPAVVQQMDTTTLLPPGATATVHPSGSLVVEVDS